jgi:hypothetical protein
MVEPAEVKTYTSSFFSWTMRATLSYAWTYTPRFIMKACHQKLSNCPVLPGIYPTCVPAPPAPSRDALFIR